jgi:hypothetical protein
MGVSRNRRAGWVSITRRPPFTLTNLSENQLREIAKNVLRIRPNGHSVKRLIASDMILTHKPV